MTDTSAARRRGPHPLMAAAATAGVVLIATTAAVTTETAAAAATQVQVYWSSESRAAGFEPKSGNWYTNPAAGLAATPYQLTRQPDLTVGTAAGTATITVDTTVGYQQVLGVGSSLEESTIFNLSRMSPSVRDAALRKLLDPVTGARFNIARIPLGTSDFTARTFYTYDDGAADPTLSRFSIQKDIDYNIIAVLKQAKAINPNLLLFGSVWSPPAWMKSNNSLIGGSLPDANIGVLATYLRKAVQAYAAQGLPLHAVTLQNEPLFSPPDYPGMTLTADQSRRVAVALRGELDANGGAATRIWAFDHNFGDGPAYAAGVLGNPGSPSNAYAAVDAIAFHDYGGEPSSMGAVKASYPAKDVAMTERAVWGTAGADRIVQYFRNQSTMYQSWVTMLDQNRSPEQWSGSPDPTMLIQNPTSPDTYWALPEYYLTAQFAKFVDRGARRVATNYGSTGTVTNVAFVNPDGTLVTVVVNQTGADQPFTLRVGGSQISSTLPAKTVGTYLWAGARSDDGSVPADLALGRPTTASSVENAGTPAAAATDGDPGTRWSSAFADPQWLQVDLGRSYAITGVTLTWEAAYARGYQIQTSPDGTTWTTVYTTSTGDGGTDNLAVTGTGRYLRLYGTTRATAYGYSLYGFQVAGTPVGGTPSASPSPSPTPSAPTGIDANAYYEITALHSGKALDVKDVSTANGGALQQWDYSGGANQKWRLMPTGGGYYRILSKNTGKAVQVRGASTANGAAIEQWDYTGADNQQWQLVSTGTGTYRIVAKGGGKALDVKDVSTANGAALQQWDYSGGTNQQFTLTLVEIIP
ncbi:RICIN domain-containing protein [Catellatospora tritici]|uniref:RICIN domain-containing protein n=1 Tax=Catellatospora tritici TaxID=2851566 RepID=UPI001C2DD0F0|nr:RICIN domain-containing protein [Catellatospora tritici]